MFEKLKKAIREEAKQKREETAFYIENGFYPSWAEEHREDKEQGLKAYSTAAKWEAYQAGTLPREKAVEIAVKRAFKQLDKKEEEKLNQITDAQFAPELSYISITVEWKKSRTWGNNPTATVRTDDGIYYGSASGCGYDKESTAIAAALNQSPAVMKALYTLKEKGLKRPPAQGRALNPFSPEPIREDRLSSNSICGYGSGYGILPYFEGGVGSSCFWAILDKCGYKHHTTASGKWFDAYYVEKKGA